jgi:hypothetical protein
MNVIVPVDEIAEILFDNSEALPNDIYIHFMNLLKRYHEHPCESTEKEIRDYLKKIAKPVRIKLQRYLPPKPFCVCTIYTEGFMKSYIFWGTVFVVCVTFGALMFTAITQTNSKRTQSSNSTK